MGLRRLLLLAGLIAAAAVSTLVALSSASTPACGAVSTPTAQCCESLEASLPAQQEDCGEGNCGTGLLSSSLGTMTGSFGILIVFALCGMIRYYDLQPRWLESWFLFKSIPRNHYIGYSKLHLVHSKELTRFIPIVIMILGVIYSAMRPVEAVPPVEEATPLIMNAYLYFANGQEYITWSHDLQVVGNSVLHREARRGEEKWKLLQDVTGESKQPPVWINASVIDGEEWTSFFIRGDNRYITGYQNKEAVHSLKGSNDLFAGSINLGFDSSYVGINGGRHNLSSINLNRPNAKDSLHILSRYKHGVHDPFPMKVAFTTYTIIFAEAQRFTEVDQCIKDGWDNDCYLKRPEKLFVYFQPLSCGVLEDWEPSGGGANPQSREWVRERKRTYRRMLTDLGITKEEAGGLLRVMMVSPACQHNMKNVFTT